MENESLVFAGWTMSDDFDIEQNYGWGDVWIVRMTSSGNILWSKIYGGSSPDIAVSIDTTNDDGFIVAGYTYSTDGDVSQPMGNGDGWLLKLDAVGNLEWEKTYGTPELLEKLYDVIALPNGKYIVSGSVTVNEGTFEEETNFWVASLDDNGNQEWQQNFPGKYIEDIRRTSSGNYIMTGTNANWESWTVLLDNMGNTVWEQNFLNINTTADFFHLQSICEATDGGFVATGEWLTFPFLPQQQSS